MQDILSFNVLENYNMEAIYETGIYLVRKNNLVVIFLGETLALNFVVVVVSLLFVFLLK